MQGELERKEEKTTAIFHWKLKEFPSLGDRVDSWCLSPPFRFRGRNWELLLYPHGLKRNDSEGHTELGLSVCDPGPPIEACCSVGIRTAEGGSEVSCSATETLDDDDMFMFTVMERSELLRRRDELLPQDVLTVTLRMKVEGGSSETVLKDASVQATFERNVADASFQTAVEGSESCDGKGDESEKTGVDKIVEDVAKLWPTSDHTDVLLKVKNAEFKAHRTILAARTPALGAMFHHDITEKASGEVSIDDCEPEVFEQLLHFIYRGAPRELTAENASALYVLADKYLVNEVKALCVCCMRDTLCLDTFCDTLMFSLMHGEDELLNTATDFFSRHMVDVMKTVEWQRFMHEHTTWANEIIIRATEMTAARYEKEKTALLDQSIL